MLLCYFQFSETNKHFSAFVYLQIKVQVEQKSFNF